MSLVVALEGDIETLSPLLFLSLIPPCHEVNRPLPPHTPNMIYYDNIIPKLGPNDHGLKLLKL